MIKKCSLYLKKVKLFTQTSKEKQVDGGNTSSLGGEPLTCINTTSIDAPKEGGRTPLHVACQRNTDYVVSTYYWIMLYENDLTVF